MKGRIVISRELCKGCAYCIDACPKGVIVEGSRFNRSGFFPVVVVNQDRCTGCAFCARMCPEIAIKVYRNSAKK